MTETIRLRTKDNIEVAGDFYGLPQSSRGVLLLHMMPADRKSWVAFAEKLTKADFSVLAIDLRGHGESEGGPDGYKKFSDEEHQASRLDVEAAAEFLKSKGVTSLHLAGASIGANLALEYLANHSEAKSAILLSPGLDYRGLKTETPARQIGSTQSVYFVASGEDMRSSGISATEMSQTLFALCNCKKEIKKFDNAGHGTTILERQPEFMDELVSWLNKFE